MNKNTVPTSYRKELKERVLKNAMDAFRSKGVRAVKMDDIANSLSISKRTLYELFENKEVLLFEGMKYAHEMKMKELGTFIETESNNVMDILLEFYRRQVEELSDVCPEFFYEIRRYPRIQEFFEEDAQQNKENAVTFFVRGIEEGFFRADVNYEIVTNVCKMGITDVMVSGMYDKYTLSEIFSNFIMVFFRGICTDKGIEVLDRFNRK